jgi:hypothetical protein
MRTPISIPELRRLAMRFEWRIALLSALAAFGARAAVAPAASGPELIVAHHIGAITYLDIDRRAIQEGVLEQKEAPMYPLELDFLWGRGAKQTQLDGVKWSIADVAGHSLVEAHASGPVILAAVPDGRYVVTGWFDGSSVKRTVTVRHGEHTIVPLEWAP